MQSRAPTSHGIRACCVRKQGRVCRTQLSEFRVGDFDQTCWGSSQRDYRSYHPTTVVSHRRRAMRIFVQAIPQVQPATASIHIQPRRLMLPRQSTTTRSPLGCAPCFINLHSTPPVNNNTGAGVFGCFCTPWHFPAHSDFSFLLGIASSVLHCSSLSEVLRWRFCNLITETSRRVRTLGLLPHAISRVIFCLDPNLQPPVHLTHPSEVTRPISVV